MVPPMRIASLWAGLWVLSLLVGCLSQDPEDAPCGDGPHDDGTPVGRDAGQVMASSDGGRPPQGARDGGGVVRVDAGRPEQGMDAGPGGGGDPIAPVDMQQEMMIDGLQMFVYVPEGMRTNEPRPLIVALHGCFETAAIHSANTGWNELADRYKFFVVYPIEPTHLNKCLDWWTATSQDGGGDAGAIEQMVDRMEANYPVAPDQIYAAGFSSGAAMAAILLANNPTRYAGAIAVAGTPYRGWTASPFDSEGTQSLDHIQNPVDRSPQQWASLMPQGANLPPLLAFVGTDDGVIDPSHTRELVEQWTGAMGVDQEPDNGGSLLKPSNDRHRYSEYHDASGNVVAALVEIVGGKHQLPVDPDGTGDDAGGDLVPAPGIFGTFTYAADEDLYFAYYSLKFFGLI